MPHLYKSFLNEIIVKESNRSDLVNKVLISLFTSRLESEILKQSSLNVDKKIGKLDPNLDFSCVLRFSDGKLQLQLIDFGRSIDMTLFPENTTFNRVVTTDGFTTIEMKLGKPWTYQIDLYGVANCGHCLLFGDYMKVAERDGIWNITKAIPRYLFYSTNFILLDSYTFFF